MLVLSRKLGQRILVPHCDLAVTVVAIEGKTVRLGVSAPAEVGVYREELWRAICEPPARSETLRQSGFRPA
jgi:carbon storage regulator